MLRIQSLQYVLFFLSKLRSNVHSYKYFLIFLLQTQSIVQVFIDVCYIMTMTAILFLYYWHANEIHYQVSVYSIQLLHLEIINQTSFTPSGKSSLQLGLHERLVQLPSLCQSPSDHLHLLLQQTPQNESLHCLNVAGHIPGGKQTIPKKPATLNPLHLYAFCRFSELLTAILRFSNNLLANWLAPRFPTSTTTKSKLFIQKRTSTTTVSASQGMLLLIHLIKQQHLLFTQSANSLSPKCCHSASGTCNQNSYAH